MIQKNRFVCVSDISKELGISQSVIDEIITKELKMERVNAKVINSHNIFSELDPREAPKRNEQTVQIWVRKNDEDTPTSKERPNCDYEPIDYDAHENNSQLKLNCDAQPPISLHGTNTPVFENVNSTDSKKKNKSHIRRPKVNSKVDRPKNKLHPKKHFKTGNDFKGAQKNSRKRISSHHSNSPLQKYRILNKRIRKSLKCEYMKHYALVKQRGIYRLIRRQKALQSSHDTNNASTEIFDVSEESRKFCPGKSQQQKCYILAKIGLAEEEMEHSNSIPSNENLEKSVGKCSNTDFYECQTHAEHQKSQTIVGAPSSVKGNGQVEEQSQDLVESDIIPDISQVRDNKSTGSPPLGPEISSLTLKGRELHVLPFDNVEEPETPFVVKNNDEHYQVTEVYKKPGSPKREIFAVHRAPKIPLLSNNDSVISVPSRDSILSLILQNCELSLKDISQKLKIPQSDVQKILTEELGMQKVLARIVDEDNTRTKCKIILGDRKISEFDDSIVTLWIHLPPSMKPTSKIVENEDEYADSPKMASIRSLIQRNLHVSLTEISEKLRIPSRDVFNIVTNEMKMKRVRAKLISKDHSQTRYQVESPKPNILKTVGRLVHIWVRTESENPLFKRQR
ncbi:hypothetical protein GE061_011130 [Apolygus lucorum]|uniref:Uncharacterized protein n=1 Tax=Apolygus lucorum TaxID=248454 RepID=A0A8S9XYM3_APOLU|nr:hypothetical protein GE061_011130 [Apolygus lucorum]